MSFPFLGTKCFLPSVDSNMSSDEYFRSPSLVRMSLALEYSFVKETDHASWDYRFLEMTPGCTIRKACTLLVQ